MSDFVVFGISNSGKTKEVIRLFERLSNTSHQHFYALTVNQNTRLQSLAKQTFILSCGKEEAIAATKSVAEQAIFIQSLLALSQNIDISKKLSQLADAFDYALKMPADEKIIDAIAAAQTIYFTGRNDGIAQEMALKANEIVQKKSDYLEGTYILHGIEEVMNPGDVVILIDQFQSELGKIKKVLAEDIGLKVFAIGCDDTIFPTIKIPDIGELGNYIYLAAGWNILIETALAMGLNPDKPKRARKIGNEFLE